MLVSSHKSSDRALFVSPRNPSYEAFLMNNPHKLHLSQEEMMINDGCATGNVCFSQYHEGRIGGDIIGNLTRGCVIDRLSTMRRQERTMYNYAAAQNDGNDNNNDATLPVPPEAPLQQINVASPASVTSSTTADTFGSYVPPLNSSWREKICHWSFNVIDHFDLSREVVAVSMNLFDRYLATRGNRCNGSTALLASLTTLHIAIKVHEVRKIKLTTLANLSRGQFGPKHIEEMEWQVLTSLHWHIHPPTSMSFLSHLLLLLPEKVSDASKEEIYAMSRYITELSVCDSSFVDMNPSAVAYSAILNSFEDKRYRRLITPAIREQFFRAIATHVGLNQDDDHVLLARPKLKRLLTTSLGTENLPQDHCSSSSSCQQNAVQANTSSTTLTSSTSPQPSCASAQREASRQHDQTVASVTSSVGGMSIQDSSYSSTRGGGGMGGGRSINNSALDISLNKTINMSVMAGGGGDDNSSMCSSKLSLKSSQSSSGYDSTSSQPRRMLVPPAGGLVVGVGRGSRVAPSPGGGGGASGTSHQTVMSTSPCSLTSSRSGGRSSVFSRNSRSHSRSPMTSLLPSS